MNEVEKHYAGQDRDGAVGSPATARDEGAAGRSTLDQVTATAKDGLRSATDAAKSAAGAAASAAGTARQTASEAYDRASSWGRDRYETASQAASEARRRSARELARGRAGIEHIVEENPVMLGVAGLAAGLLLGALLPTTRRENQVFGRYADEVRDQGLRYARDLAQQGKQFVEESLTTTARAVQENDGGRRG